MTILVIDVGTSGLRVAAVRPDATIAFEQHRELLPSSPEPGFVEFDATEMAAVALDVARAVLADAGPVDAVGITNQRASTIVWDRATGEPVGPGIGWQDLRTAGTCLILQADGIRVAPNASATKAGWLLDAADPDRTRDLCVGTVDTWLAWHLSEGAVHVTDATNAAVTGLLGGDASDWEDKVLDALRIPRRALPQVVDSSGIVGQATALDGAPPIAALVGDQQSSLIGQGGVRPGLAKITFGTGGMLDLHLGEERPRFERQGAGGCFPIVAWRRGGTTTWGVEAVMLSAGTNVEWLRDDLGVIATSAESHDVASRCDSADGVVYVPALLGLGTPRWDYGAAGHAARPHAGQRAPPDRAGRARRGGAARCRPGRRRRDRHRAHHPVPASRRRHDREPHLRPSPRQRRPAAGGGVAGEGGHHARCRVPRRLGRRHLGRVGRHRRHLAPQGRRRAERHPRSRAVEAGVRPGRRLDPRALLALVLKKELAPPSTRGSRSEVSVMMRPTRSLLVALALVSAASLGACSDDDGDAIVPEDSVPEDVAVSGATGDAVDCEATEGETVTVEIPDFVFNPERVQVSPCDEIVWSNIHTQAHTSTANGDVSWSTGNIAKDQKAEPIVFDTPGEFSYMCALHPFMKGVVEVA